MDKDVPLPTPSGSTVDALHACTAALKDLRRDTGGATASTPGRTPIDADTLRDLESLGYI